MGESTTLLSLWGVLEIQSLEIPIIVKDAHRIVGLRKLSERTIVLKGKVFFSWIFDVGNFKSMSILIINNLPDHIWY